MLAFSMMCGCTGDYDGEVFERVVSASNVEVRDRVPDGFRVIGDVYDFDESEVDGSRAIARTLWCQPDRRLLRRMKRAAARNGGELLIDFQCAHEQEEDLDPIHDDPETSRVETELYCFTECTALVARAWAHDS